MADLLDWDQAINGYRGGVTPPPAPAAPAVNDVVDPWQAAGSQALAAATPAGRASVTAPSQAPQNFSQAMGNYHVAAQGEAQAVRAQADAEARAIEQHGAALQQQAQQEAVARQAFEAEQKALQERREQSLKEAQLLNNQADNMKVVDKRTTGQRVMGILAVALGGLGDAFSSMGGGQSNHAGSVMRQIDAQVQRDLELQQEAIQDKRKSAAAKFTELGIANQFSDDARLNFQFAQTLRERQYASELKAVAGSTANEQARAAAEVAASQIEERAALNQAKLIEARDEQRMRSSVARANSTGGGVGGSYSASDILRKFDAGEPLSKHEMDYALKLDAQRDKQTAADNKNQPDNRDIIPGYSVMDTNARLPEKGEVVKAREIAAGVAGVRSSGNKMADLYEQIQKAEAAGDSDKADALRGQYYTAGGQFLVQKSLAGGQGVINASDAERDAKEGAVPPPPGAPASAMSYFNNMYKGVSPSSATMRAITKDVADNGVSRLTAYNLTPANRTKHSGGPGPTAAGQTAPTGMVKFELNGKVGSVPAGQADAFQAKYPSAKRL